MSCAYVPSPMKFTKFIDESVGKNKWISSTYRGYTFLLTQRLFEEKIFSWSLSILVGMNIIQTFWGSNFVQFCILKFIIYVNNNMHKAILIGQFPSIWRKFCYHFYLAWTKVGWIFVLNFWIFSYENSCFCLAAIKINV